MTKTFLKQVIDLINIGRQGARSKLIDSVIYTKNGVRHSRGGLKSIDKVHNEIIQCINWLLEEDELIKQIKSIEYSIGISKDKVVLIDFENLTINNEKIPQEQLKPSKIKMSAYRNTNFYFPLV